jgi:ATP-binding cassette subfamily B multidrug efflux pump
MQISQAFASYSRITEYLGYESEKSGAKELPERFSPIVTFQNVSFSYDNTNPIVKDISFTVEPGKHAALVGLTGAGKTTLVKLLLRFYECQNGKIAIDDSVQI